MDAVALVPREPGLDLRMLCSAKIRARGVYHILVATDGQNLALCQAFL
jgi:hypothetical protein